MSTLLKPLDLSVETILFFAFIFAFYLIYRHKVKLQTEHGSLFIGINIGITSFLRCKEQYLLVHSFVHVCISWVPLCWHAWYRMFKQRMVQCSFSPCFFGNKVTMAFKLIFVLSIFAVFAADALNWKNCGM